MVSLYQVSRLRDTVSKAETKTCPLCAALNYHGNIECMSCGWRGAFGNDAALTDFHWERLTERYEEVRMEHLVAQGRHALGDFGRERKVSLWQTLRAAWGLMNSVLQARRPAKAVIAPQNSAVPPK